MYQLSAAAFDVLARGSHTAIVVADAYYAGKQVASSLRVISGSVTVDRTAKVRRSLRATVLDPDGALTSSKERGVLTPFGTDLVVSRGVLVNGDPVVAPLGVFRLGSTPQADDGTLQVDVAGYDWARRISRNRFSRPYTVPKGTNYMSAIQGLVNSRIPDVVFNAQDTDHVTPLLTFDAESDPWDALVSMTTSIGFTIYFDADGRLVVQDEPDPAKVSVSWQYAEDTLYTSRPRGRAYPGDPGDVYNDAYGTTEQAMPTGNIGNLLAITRDYDDDRGYNGAIVTGETTSNDQPARGEIWDDDPNSPTYYLGPYGQVPYFEASQYVTTNVQAQDAAAAALRRLRGAAVSYSWTGIPNPAQDVGDVVRLGRGEVDDAVIIDTITMPLSAAEPAAFTGHTVANTGQANAFTPDPEPIVVGGGAGAGAAGAGTLG